MLRILCYHAQNQPSGVGYNTLIRWEYRMMSNCFHPWMIRMEVKTYGRSGTFLP